MRFLLNSFGDYWDNLVARLAMTEIIFALAFAIVGLSLAIIARRVAIVVRKTDKIDDKDPILIGFKAVGLACLFVSVLIIILRAGV